MAWDAANTANLRGALQEAVVKCSERCLYRSAKWAAEQLVSIPVTEDETLGDSQMTEGSNDENPIVIARNNDPEEAALEAREFHKYLFAKSLFDCREFDRCAAVFLPEATMAKILSKASAPKGAPESSGTPKGKGKAKASTTTATPLSPEDLPKLSQKSLFLALYAKFMSGEKRKDEDSEMVMGPHDGGNTINKQLVPIIRILETWFRGRHQEGGVYIGSQGWLEFLYGTVLSKEKNEEAAMQWLLRSVHAYPMNWSCWLEICGLISRMEEMNDMLSKLPQNIMTFMFHLHASLELYQTNPTLYSILNQLLAIFPSSPFLHTCRALLSYHTKDFALAESQFSSLLASNPHRLDSLDHYSNILYVMNLRPKLSFLAHLCTSIDKFRPETCVVVGNYYSILSQHEKAVNYFRRALTLDRNFLSAWTLMGHEYVELKNTHAAIESYRRAVDVNRRDYRAWYGLGQTYEVLEMHAYALWYFKRAAGLRPWDGKMWMAVGSCLQKMNRDYEGIKALKRALIADSDYDGNSFADGSFARADRGSMDPEVLLQIASMYERLENEEECKVFMEMCVAQEEGPTADEFTASMSMHQAEEYDGSDNDSSAADIKRTSMGASGGGLQLNSGTGVTASTSRARMWLARYAMRHGDYARAMQLATELCADGVEVEESKALQREIRARGGEGTEIS